MVSARTLPTRSRFALRSAGAGLDIAAEALEALLDHEWLTLTQITEIRSALGMLQGADRALSRVSS